MNFLKKCVFLIVLNLAFAIFGINTEIIKKAEKSESSFRLRQGFGGQDVKTSSFVKTSSDAKAMADKSADKQEKINVTNAAIENIEKTSELSKKQVVLCDGLIGWITKKYNLDKKIVYELGIESEAKLPITQSFILNVVVFNMFWLMLAKMSEIDENQVPIINQDIAYAGILVLSGFCGIFSHFSRSLVSIPFDWIVKKFPAEGSYWLFKKIFQTVLKTANMLSVLVVVPVSDIITRELIKKMT